ncbi:MAG: hypothetical protein E6I76_20700 [Chloroflexi bacterium]|nr:MAG: hypothetical protein E6I76_20700 [Chloroflexota bacterium]
MAPALHHQLPLRRLTGSVLAVPLAFAVVGVLRALWAMRRTTGCTAGDAVRAMRVWFALSWVVTLACVRGLVSAKAEFLRTPKSREGEGTLRTALRTVRAETALAALAVVTAVVMMVRAPSVAPLLLGALLLFEAGVYSSAPWATVSAERVARTPDRQVWRRSSQNTGERPPWRSAAVPAVAAVLAVAAVAVVALVTGGPPGQGPPFGGGGAGNLVQIGRFVPRVPGIGGPQQPAPGSTPSPAPGGTPSGSPGSASPAASATPAPSPGGVRGATAPAATGSPAPQSPAATASPGAPSTPSASGATQQPTGSPPSSAAPAPSGTPAGAPTPPSASTPTPTP